MSAPHSHAVARSRAARLTCAAVTALGATLALARAVAPAGGAVDADWPQFRGPNGLAVTPNEPAAPLTFDGGTGKAVLWRMELDEAGRSSPVVVRDKLFITGGTAEKQWVYCYRVADGSMLWKQQATVARPEPRTKDADAHPGDSPADDAAGDPAGENVAVNTPAADADRVYAVFGTGDVVAFDHDGRHVWSTSLRPIVTTYGYTSSPLLFRKKLIIQLDHSGKSGSALLALDAATGKQLWRTPRTTSDAFGSPILAETPEGPQVITSAAGAMHGYDAETGRELWKADCGGSNDAPSPAYAAGVAVTSHSADRVYAVKVDGKGDVTATRLAWKTQDGCEAASPVATGNLVFVPHDDRLVCYAIRTGKELWEVPDLEKAYASLCVVGDRLYYVARTGEGFVFRAGEQFEELGRFNVGEGTDATPAFADGKILIRGNRWLWCFGLK